MQEFPPATERYFSALGRFVAFWAMTEFCLDRTVEYAIAKWDGDDCPEKMLPKDFSRKAALLREYVRVHDLGGNTKETVADMRKTFNEVIDELYEVGEARHWAAHGNGLLTIVARHDNDTIKFLRSIRHRPGQIDSRKYTLKQLSILANRAWGLSQSLFLMDYVVFQAIPKNSFDKMFPKHSRKFPAVLPVSKRARH